MKDKKGEGRFKVFLALILIIAFIIGIMWYLNIWNMKNKISGIKNLKSKINNPISSNTNTFQPYTPLNDLSWCYAQQIPVDSSETSPSVIQIIGENTEANCCVKRYSGFNNCLNMSTDVDVCITSPLGGTIKYTTINSQYKNPIYYERFIEDLDKIYNPYFNQQLKCNMMVYL